MSNPTTPFSWQMPTNADLVTDLPADFEVFGQAVATSMADLLGGTTGQVLSKATNADMDFTWTTANPGDITGVTAGVGITGGGTSGTVTVTNDMATTITTAGDLIYGTGSGTYTRRAIGSTAQVLTVSGGVPTWATPSATTLPAFGAYSSTNQSITQNVWTKITFGTEEFDTASNFASSRFTPTTAGYYQINARGYVGGGQVGFCYASFYVNGVSFKQIFAANTGDYFPIGSTLIYLNGSTDYVEVYVNANQTSPVIYSGQSNTYFNGVGVRS